MDDKRTNKKSGNVTIFGISEMTSERLKWLTKSG